MIPKNLFILCYKKELVHQIFKDNIEVLRKMNPEYNVIIQDQESFAEWFKVINPYDYENYYCKLNKKIGAMIADYQRQTLLYYIGGFYIDIKTCLKNPIDTFIKDTDKTYYCWWYGAREILFCFFGSEPDHPLLKDALKEIHYKIDNYDKSKIQLRKSLHNVIDFAGPKAFTKLWRKNNHGVVLEPNFRKNVIYIKIKNYKDYYVLPYYKTLREYCVI